MALKAWYPLNGDANNRGTDGTLSLTQTTAPAWAAGKVTANSMTTGGFKWTAAQAASVLNNDAFSYACWFYVDAASGTSASFQRIFGNEGGTGSSNRRFTCGQYPTVNGFHISSWNGSSLIDCCRIADALPSYKWTHICYTYGAGYIKVYINGVLKATTALTMANDSYSAETQVLHNYSGRRIQDVRIYDHALSAKEVAELAKGLMLHIPMYAGYPGVGTNLCQGWQDMRAISLGQYYANVITDNNFFGLKVGDTYTYRVKLTCPSTKPVSARIQYYTDGSTRTGPVSDVIVPAGSTGYTYLTDTITAAKRAYTRMELLITSRDTSVTTADTVYVGEVKVELGSAATPWSPGTSGTDYAIKDCSGHQVSVGTSGSVPVMYGSGPRYSSSACFDGAGACLWPITDPIKSTADEFTISVWFMTTSASTTQCIWNGRKTVGYACAIFILSTNMLRVDDSVQTSAGTIAVNTWYHLAVTWKSGGNKTIYLNGTQISSVSAGTLSKSNSYASIGRSSDNDTLSASNYFSGQLSDFRIYATALTADQVKELYSAPVSISKGGACHAASFSEGASAISVKKSGVMSANAISSFPGKYDNNVLIEPDGSCWAHIVHHADPTTYKFGSTDTFATGVYRDARRFFDASMCDIVDKWEFLLVQKADASTATARYRWTQPKNPNTAAFADVAAASVTKKGTADGYSAISSAYGGIYKRNASTYYCANNGSSGNWWGAIGSWTAHEGGIPGYNAVVVKDGGFQDLYLRIDNVTWGASVGNVSFDRGGAGVRAVDYFEN